MPDPYEYTDSILKQWGPGGTAYEGEHKPQAPAANNLNDQIASLRREIAQLEAMRQKPRVTSISSSPSSLFSEPEGWAKTSRQIELESELAELLRNQAIAKAEPSRKRLVSPSGRVAADLPLRRGGAPGTSRGVPTACSQHL